MHMRLHCGMTPKDSHAAVPGQSGVGTTAQYCSATTSSVQGLLRSLEVSDWQWLHVPTWGPHLRKLPGGMGRP